MRLIPPSEQWEGGYSVRFAVILEVKQTEPIVWELLSVMRIWDSATNPLGPGDGPLKAYLFDVSKAVVYHCQYWEIILPALWKLGLPQAPFCWVTVWIGDQNFGVSIVEPPIS